MFTPALVIACLILPLLAIVVRVLLSQRNALGIIKAIAQAVAFSAIFGVIGPLIGTFVFALLYYFPPLGDIKNLSSFGPGLLIGGYLFGAVPAVLTGAVAGALKLWLQSWWHYFAIGLVGLAFSLFVTTAMLNPIGPSLRVTIHYVFANRVDPMVAIPGFVAAMLSTWVLCRRHT